MRTRIHLDTGWISCLLHTKVWTVSLRDGEAQSEMVQGLTMIWDARVGILRVA